MPLFRASGIGQRGARKSLRIRILVLRIERYAENARERYLTSEEFARLGDVLRLAETTGLEWAVDETKPKANRAPKPENRARTLDPFAVAAIRLLILTGARLREILHAKWDYVDFERGLLFLQDGKTGKKPVYLSSAAGLEGVRLHDLRHSFASIGAGASLGLPIIGKLLGHSQPATTARYAHLDEDPMRRAVDAIGATISAAMDKTKSGAVISLKKPPPFSPRKQL